ncbi:MAG: YitT family protein [Bacteroides sp.]
MGVQGKLNVAKLIREYALITVGLITYTMGWSAFLIPMHITGGGATGVGNLVYMLTGFPVGYTFLIFNALLILIAMKVVGANFGMKTIYGVVVASALLVVEQMLIKECILQNDRLLATILGGALSGLGIGIAIGQGGSTGGTDIVAMIVTKYRNVSPGRVILAADAVIISTAFFVLEDLTIPQRLEAIVYGYIVMIATSFVVDLYLNGTRQSLQVLIFSSKHTEIADKITTDMHRGVTMLKGTGWYSKENSEILLVIIRKSEQGALLHLVRSVDPNAFTSVASVMGVYGLGFDKLK